MTTENRSSNIPSEQVVDLAERLAREVGARIRQVAASPEATAVVHKGVSDLVTEVDIWSEQVITTAVERAFPEHVIVGEETSADLAARRGEKLETIVAENICWIVDPLDGTSNFSNHIPYSAVSIAVSAHGERRIGVVYDPYRDEMFVAVKGRGATLNGAPIMVSQKTELINCLVATGFPNDRWQRWDEYRPSIDALVMNFRNVRAFGAAALDLCWIACGRLDAFFEYNLKPWDVAAASLIVEEAGGKGACFSGEQQLPYSNFSRSFLFSGPGIFEPFCNLMKASNASIA